MKPVQNTVMYVSCKPATLGAADMFSQMRQAERVVRLVKKQPIQEKNLNDQGHQFD